MLLQINKKILIYIFFFILFATLNNNNFEKFKFSEINEVKIYGLNEDENYKLKKKLNSILSMNLFFLNKIEVKKYLDTIDIIDNYTILKKYPSSLEIRINKTTFLANVYKDEKIFLLGSNRKLIKTNKPKKELPNIFGKFDKNSFFKLLSDINDSQFKEIKIKNLFFFKSGRWDIETNSSVLIKLPKNNSKDILDLSFRLLEKKKSKEIRVLDLRQNNQIIINAK